MRLSVAIAYLVGLFAGGVDGGDDLVVPNDAISCPCFSSAVSAVSAAPWRRQRPRPSPSGDVWTSYPLASAPLGPYGHRALAITATAVRAKRDADLLVASRFAMHTTGRWRGKGGRASGYKRAVLFGL